MIYFTKIYQLKGLKPKNKGHTNFYECCDLTKKVYLTPVGYSLPSCIVIEFKVSGLSLTIAMERKKHCIKLCKAFDEIRFPSFFWDTMWEKIWILKSSIFAWKYFGSLSLSKICLILCNSFSLIWRFWKKERSKMEKT